MTDAHILLSYHIYYYDTISGISPEFHQNFVRIHRRFARVSPECVYVYVCIHMYIYIYIYMYRERERENDSIQHSAFAKSSPHAGPSAGAEVARLRKWHV